jgi:hypothetical protein
VHAHRAPRRSADRRPAARAHAAGRTPSAARGGDDALPKEQLRAFASRRAARPSQATSAEPTALCHFIEGSLERGPRQVAFEAKDEAKHEQTGRAEPDSDSRGSGARALALGDADEAILALPSSSQHGATRTPVGRDDLFGSPFHAKRPCIPRTRRGPPWVVRSRARTPCFRFGRPSECIRSRRTRRRDGGSDQEACPMAARLVDCRQAQY